MWFLAWISLKKGFILNETDFSWKNISLFFYLPYDTYKNGLFVLCIFNELIRNFSTCFRTIAAESICLYTLLSWFVSFFNKRSAVFNWHMCRNYKFQSLDSEGPRVWPKSLIHENDPRVWLTSLTHENDPRVWPTNLTHENDPRVWPMSLTYENDPRVWPTSLTH